MVRYMNGGYVGGIGLNRCGDISGRCIGIILSYFFSVRYKNIKVLGDFVMYYIKIFDRGRWVWYNGMERWCEMRLEDWADMMGVSVGVAEQRYQAGKIAGARRVDGKVVVPDDAVKTPMVKLSVWADMMGMSYQSAWNKFKAKEIPGAFKLGGKMILVPRPENTLRLGIAWDKIDLGPSEEVAQENVLRAIQMMIEKKYKMAEVVWRIGGIKELMG